MAQRFHFGRALSGALWMLRRDVLVLLPLLMIWGGIDFALYKADDALGLDEFSSIVTLSIFSVPLMTGAITLIALSGGMTGSIQALSFAATRYLPLLLCYILSYLGILVGFLLLIIPGLILMVMWSIAVPILINEEASPMRALGESYRRIRVHFEPIAGIMVLFIGLSVATGFVLGFVYPMSYGVGEGFALGVETVVAVFLGVIGAYLNAAIYSELSHVSGPDVSVFD